MADPSMGEIWWVDLDPTVGREQSGLRPALVVSDDVFNHGPAELAVVLPITSRDKKLPTQVRIEPGRTGLSVVSFVKPEDIRSVSKSRFRSKSGRIEAADLALVKDRLRILLDL